MTISPVVRLWAGALRELRQLGRVTAEEAAKHLRQDRSLISRYESGGRIPSPQHLTQLLELYDVEPESRDEIIETARSLTVGGWWSPYAESIREGLLDYVWCEWHASEIQIFEPILVPGLAQVTSYVQALSDAGGRALSREQAKRWVKFRQRRLDVVDRESPPRITIILYEPALHLPVGDAAVMSEQYERLLELGQRPHVDVRVLAYRDAAGTVSQGSFTVFRLPAPLDRAAVVELTNDIVFVEGQLATDEQCDHFDRLHRKALSADDSISFITKLKRDLS